LKLMPRDVVLEYLPDISTAIDRLGRILFVFRLNIKQLTVTRPSSQVANLIQAMRASYRNLGDSYLNLLYYSATSEDDQEAVEA